MSNQTADIWLAREERIGDRGQKDSAKEGIKMKENDKTERKNKSSEAKTKGLDSHQKMAFVIGAGLLVFVLLYVIPRSITACGAQETDVLSFYGTVLGTMVAVATIAITISFNRKQIQRDAYLKSEVDRWMKIDEAISKSIEDINPQYVLQLGLEAASDGNTSVLNPIACIAALQRYKMRCSIATDRLYSCMSTTDADKLKNLLASLSDASKLFSGIANDEYLVYVSVGLAQQSKQVAQMRESEKKNPGSFTEENRRQLQALDESIRTTSQMFATASVHTVAEYQQEMCAAYENTYRPLLALKGQTFDAIYRSIQLDADNSLSFWLRK